MSPTTILNRNRIGQSGFSLIEVIVVVAMIGGMMALGAIVLFPSNASKVADETTRLVSVIRYLYDEAASQNRHYRLTFDLDNQTYRAESSPEPFLATLRRSNVDEEAAKQKKVQEEAASENPEADQNEKGPEPEAFSGAEGFLKESYRLPQGVKIKDILVLHEKDLKAEGIVHLYFLPNGWVEPSVIHLSDEDEEIFYSIQVNPLTGRAKIFDNYLAVDPETLEPEAQLE